MLMPRKTKFRKQHRGRRRGTSKGQLTVQYGDYGQTYPGSDAWDLPAVSATHVERSRKLGLNLFVDRIGEIQAQVDAIDEVRAELGDGADRPDDGSPPS